MKNFNDNFGNGSRDIPGCTQCLNQLRHGVPPFSVANGSKLKTQRLKQKELKFCLLFDLVMILGLSQSGKRIS
jgi:hypothetical protein